MKIIDEQGNEVDAGCLVEGIMEPRAKKSKVTRIPDGTPAFTSQSAVNEGGFSFRDQILEELDFPECSFHEVSKKDLQPSRIADPVAFRMGTNWGGYTHVRINFYARKYVVEVDWATFISGGHCLSKFSKSSSSFTLEYEHEKTANSGIKMIKDFLLSTMNSDYCENYAWYCNAKGIKR